MKPSFIRQAMNRPVHLSAGCLFGLLFLASGQPAGAQTPRTFTTHLEGQVIDRPQSRKLLLCKDDENVWLTQPTEIPIRNGKFSYTVTDTVERMYILAFAEEYYKSAFRGILFINEGDTLHATLYPNDYAEENIICGSPQNDSLYARAHWIDNLFKDIRRKQDSLHHAGNYFSETFETLREKQEKTDDEDQKKQLAEEIQAMLDDGRAYSPEALALEEISVDTTL